MLAQTSTVNTWPLLRVNSRSGPDKPQYRNTQSRCVAARTRQARTSATSNQSTLMSVRNVMVRTHLKPLGGLGVLGRVQLGYLQAVCRQLLCRRFVRFLEGTHTGSSAQALHKSASAPVADHTDTRACRDERVHVQ
jgi:hypothetical protein